MLSIALTSLLGHISNLSAINIVTGYLVLQFIIEEWLDSGLGALLLTWKEIKKIER